MRLKGLEQEAYGDVRQTNTYFYMILVNKIYLS